jgi:hypothetical protein
MAGMCCVQKSWFLALAELVYHEIAQVIVGRRRRRLVVLDQVQLSGKKTHVQCTRDLELI